MHIECQDFAVADCKENATYLPGKDLSAVKHTHHWREGNLPSSSKCAVCKKSCFTAECLAGFRCEWCGMTVKERFVIRSLLPWFLRLYVPFRRRKLELELNIILHCYIYSSQVKRNT